MKILLLLLMIADIQATRLTLLLQSNEIELISSTHLWTKSYRLNLERAFLTDSTASIQTIKDIIGGLSITNVDPSADLKLKDLVSRSDFLLNDSLDLLRNYTAVFYKQQISDTASLSFDVLKIEDLVPGINTVAISQIAAKLVEVKIKGDSIIKLDEMLDLLNSCVIASESFNEKMAKLIDLIHGIFHNRFSAQNMKQLENLDRKHRLFAVETLGLVGTSTDLSFELSLEKVVESKLYPRYLPVQLFNYILGQDFFGTNENSLAFPYRCNFVGCFRDLNSRCVIDLNSNNLTHIINTCVLQKSYLDFEVTSQGILVYSNENEDLKKLIKAHSLEITIFPSLLKFSGNFSLTSYGKIFKGGFDMKTELIPSAYSNSAMPLIFNRNFIELVLSQISDASFLFTVSLIIILNIVGGIICIKSCKVLLKLCKKVCCCDFKYSPLAANQPVSNPPERIVLNTLNASTSARPSSTKTSKTTKKKPNSD